MKMKVEYRGKWIKYGEEKRFGYISDFPEKCPDCGALKGEKHIHGCDIEECPICGNQLIGCSCFTFD
jgi:hypothetical protein